MRVKFLRDELYENEGRGVGHSFKSGEVYDFDQDFADRWIRRGAAEAVGDDGKAVDTTKRFTPVETPATEKPKADPDTKDDDKKVEPEKADANKSIHPHKTGAR